MSKLDNLYDRAEFDGSGGTISLPDAVADFLCETMRRSINTTRFVGKEVNTPLVLRHAGAPALMTGVALIGIDIETDGEYITLARVTVSSLSGNQASGYGVSVKGRDDRFVPRTGAAVAVREALNNAFIVLGQKDTGAKADERFREEPVDIITLLVDDGWVGAELLA